MDCLLIQLSSDPHNHLQGSLRELRIIMLLIQNLHIYMCKGKLVGAQGYTFINKC